MPGSCDDCNNSVDWYAHTQDLFESIAAEIIAAMILGGTLTKQVAPSALHSLRATHVHQLHVPCTCSASTKTLPMLV